MYGRADGMPSFQLTVAMRTGKAEISHSYSSTFSGRKQTLERSKLDRAASRSRGRRP
jgi:hypothetical protein